MKKAILIALLTMVYATQAWAMCGAVDHWIDDKVQSDNYGVKLGGMLLAGIHNIVEAPAELVVHPYQNVKDGEGAKGFFVGVGEGLYHMVEGIGVGVVNILGSPIPNYHGITKADDHNLGSSATTTA